MARDLWLYDRLARLVPTSYRAKLGLVAAVAAQAPLVCVVVAWAAFGARGPSAIILVAAILAVAAGTGLVMIGLHHLLEPVMLAGEALRAGANDRGTAGEIAELPTRQGDEAGALMTDAADVLGRLQRMRDALRYVDTGTGLPNRQALVRDMGRAPRVPVAACVLRFASYARVVEALDPAAAEAAAADLAARLLAGPAAGARLYRLGGPDFIMLLDESHARDPERCEAVLAQCIEAASALLPAGDVMIDPALLAGVAVWPADARTPDLLVDKALAAVPPYRSETRVGFHSPSARKAASERRRGEQEIQAAFQAGQLVLHYQPVIDLARARVTGAEALIRWQHPERGLVPPGEFIGIAERCGLMDRIGPWALREACRQAREWADAGLDGLSVAVNLSARQFLDPQLIQYVDEALQASGIAPDMLAIELTEATAMLDDGQARLLFGRLRDRGVRIAIDDFGTGSSALSLLRKLPFDTLKIDRAFVAEVHATRESQAICRALVTLSSGLGLRVLAEGVEQAEEVRYLYEAGCDLYQGTFFCRPLRADAIVKAVPGLSLASASLAMSVPRRGADRLRLAG